MQKLSSSRLRKFGYICLAVLAFATLCLFYLTATTSGLGMLASAISRLASNENQKIQISGLQGIWSGETQIKQIELSDATGMYASINNVRSDWSRSSLFALKFSTPSVSVGEIDLDRLPISKGGSEKPFSFPVQLDIKTFKINTLRLGDTLVPKGANLTVTGNITAEIAPLNVSGAVLIDRAERKEDKLLAKFTYTPEQELVSLDLGYAESSGGVLATLLELPDSPELSANINATGSLESLKLTANADVDQKNVLNLKGDLKQEKAVTRLTLLGDGQPSSIVPKKFHELLQGPFNLDVDVSRTDNGIVQINRANINTDTFFGVATGKFDPFGSHNISGGLTAKAAAINLTNGIIPGIANFALKSIAFKIKGPAEHSTVELSADVPLIDFGTSNLIGAKAHFISEDFDFATQSGFFEMNGSASSMAHANTDINRFLAGDLYFETTGSISGKNLVWDKLTLQNEIFTGASSGEYSLESKEVQATLNAEVKQSGFPVSVQKYLAEMVDLNANVKIGSSNRIDISRLKIASGPISIEGSSTIASGTVLSDLSLALANINTLLPEATGRLDGRLQVSGASNAPNINLILETSEIKMDDQRITNLAMRVDGLASIVSPDLVVKLEGAINGQPLTGGTNFKVVNGQRKLDAIELKNADNILFGSLTLDANGLPNGDIKFQLPDIAPLAALALQKLEGALSGEIEFSTKNATPSARVNLQGKSLRQKDTLVEDLAASIALDDYAKKLTLSGSANIGIIQSGSTSIRNTKLTLKKEDDWTGFNVDTVINGDIPTQAVGRIKTSNGVTRIELTQANAKLVGQSLTLSAPTSVEIENGNVNLSGARIGVGSGQAVISGTAGEQLNLNVSLSQLNASVVNQFASDLQADGAVNGDLNILGNSASPEITFDLNWLNARTKQTREAGLSGLKIAADGSFSNKVLRYNSALSDTNGLRFNGGGIVKIEPAPILDLNYSGEVPFSILAATLNQQGLALTGMAKADIKISGLSSNPQIGGSIQSGNARFVHAESGIAIEQLDLNMKLDGQTARIEKLQGKISTGGRVTIDGTIGIQAGNGFPADIKVRIDSGVYADGKSVNTKFDASLTLNGSLTNNPLLSGKVDLAKTVVTVPDRVPDSISRLNVQHKNASAEVERQASSFKPKNSNSGTGINLDLQINATNQIFVRGRGIDAELGGALRLAGRLEAPTAVGGFDLRRGRLSILGKRLNFTSGKISFAGSLLPELDLTAENQSDDTTIIVQVVGPADGPEFRFSSVPSLAEDEVLARLIFNRNMSNLSPLQIVQLGQAVATLTGTGGNSSLLDKFQKLIKVDDLDVKTNAETGETTVGVGRYINDKTYIGVERGNTAGTGKATIDLSIGRGVKLRGEATETGKNKAGIFFERDY